MVIYFLSLMILEHKYIGNTIFCTGLQKFKSYYKKDFYHRLHQRVYRSLPTNLFHPYHYEMKGVVFFSKINRQSMGTGRYFLPAHNGGR